ncbi:MAG TPA: hypothetical protein VJS64_16865 [Pyrinomonadaceae bacterium]|nr:hypothetical protein [Pyrinomonadaceae bacterium]
MRVNEPEYLHLMLDRLPPGWKPAVSPIVVNMYSLLISNNSKKTNVKRFNLLYAGGIRAARSLDPDLVLQIFESDIQIYVGILARRRIFVHAGVVEWQGQAIVIPGRSLSGKSTLTAELVRAGATYYSDEYAVLDERGRVHPYPRKLGLRPPGSDEQTKVRAEELGGRVGNKPLPVGMIVVSQYHEGARWRPRQLSAGQGALEVLANTVPARTRPEQSLSSIQQAVLNARILKGRRGDAKETAEYILQSLSRA